MTTDKDASTRAKKPIDWERYGLSSEPNLEKGPLLGSCSEGESSHFQDKGDKELFHEDQLANSKPWWKTNFFLSEPVLFGVWDGVFTSCMINLFSVIIFLRVGWIVGNAGVGPSIGIVCITVLIGTTTVLSGIGICERCHLESGGVHFLLSHIFGAR
ncbi:Solute carrier family 12 member 8, partial [Stegodyphus mimosarum]